MEQDIEKVERLIERCNECKLKECINCEISWTEVQAIKKLYKAYKELEEENENEFKRGFFTKVAENKANTLKIESQVIPKSLIKETIEELKNRIEKYREYAEQGIETDVEWVDNVADRETVKVLQELLEKRK